MKRIAFYGGSFDPLHRGHLTIAKTLSKEFDLDEFVFIPAFHAPHKERKPTSAFHRYTMICLASQNEAKIKVSKMELELPEKPYTVETLTRIKTAMPGDRIFFVMGADSWQDILTWREWEKVLTMVNIIVVTRPDYEIGFSHVTDAVRERIVDRRNQLRMTNDELRIDEEEAKGITNETQIYITDEIQIDVSATEIRNKIRENAADWQVNLPEEVANYIKKYELYSEQSTVISYQ